MVVEKKIAGQNWNIGCVCGYHLKIGEVDNHILHSELKSND